MPFPEAWAEMVSLAALQAALVCDCSLFKGGVASNTLCQADTGETALAEVPRDCSHVPELTVLPP